jgi:membrane associated rhomboid family serine protease
MFPISDVIPSRTTPFVTVSLIVLNALAFVYALQLNDGELRILVHEYGVVPAVFSWPSVISSMFLHAGWLHLCGNMLYLWIFGDNVEDRMGHGRYLVLYLACGAAAAIAQVMFKAASEIPMVGASGAVAGVMGAYFLFYPHSRVLTAVFMVFFLDLIEIPAIFFLGIWFLMQLLSGVGSIAATTGTETGGIAFMAHVAGFAAGLVGVFVFRKKKPQPVEWWDDVDRRWH